MENDRKFRALAIAAICVAIVGVSVAYAALSASLNVTGTAKVSTSNSWNVSASSLVCTASGSAYFGSEAAKKTTETFTATGGTVNWDATFTAPTDSVKCTMTWTNSGTIDAAVEDLKISSSGSYKDNFTYDVVMGTTNLSITVPANKYLKAGTSKTVTFTVVFDKDKELETLPSTKEEVTFTAAFGFVQATSGVAYTEL